MPTVSRDIPTFDVGFDVVIVGAGACGLSAGLAAADAGAELADMTGYQGHGGLAAGYGLPILWPVILEGGFQVNSARRRFSDESQTLTTTEAAVVSCVSPREVNRVIDEQILPREFLDPAAGRKVAKAGNSFSATAMAGA